MCNPEPKPSSNPFKIKITSLWVFEDIMNESVICIYWLLKGGFDDGYTVKQVFEKPFPVTVYLTTIIHVCVSVYTYISSFKKR